MADFISTIKSSPTDALQASVGETFQPGKAGPGGTPWIPMQYSEPEIADIIEKYGVNYRFIYGENPAPHQSGYWYIGDNKNLVYEYGVGYRVYDKNQPSFFSSLISNFAPIGAILAAALAVGMYVGSSAPAGSADFLGSGISPGASTGISPGATTGISVPPGGGVASGLVFDGLAPAASIAGTVGGGSAVAGGAGGASTIGGLLSGAGQIAGVVGAVAGAAGSVAAAQNAAKPPAQQGGAGFLPLILLGGGALLIFAIVR